MRLTIPAALLLASLSLGCATTLRTPSGFVQVPDTNVWCAPEDVAACERAWFDAVEIVQRIEGLSPSGRKVLLKWKDTGSLNGKADSAIGRAEEKDGGWIIRMGQDTRANLHGYLVHEFVHRIRGKPGHDPRYDAHVFAWKSTRERTGV